MGDTPQNGQPEPESQDWRNSPGEPNKEISIPRTDVRKSPAINQAHHTALEKTNPNKANQIIAMAGAGHSKRYIQKKLNCDYRTVVRIISQYYQQVGQWEEYAAQQARMGSAMAIERITEELSRPGKHGLKDLSVTYGILTEKSALLAGKPTSINESRQGPSIEDAQDSINQARRVIDVTPGKEE